MAKNTYNYGTIKVQNIAADKDSLRIHGIDNAGFSSDSESGKSEFDDEYYKHKPHPIVINKKNISIVNKNVESPKKLISIKVEKKTNDYKSATVPRSPQKSYTENPTNFRSLSNNQNSNSGTSANQSEITENSEDHRNTTLTTSEILAIESRFYNELIEQYLIRDNSKILTQIQKPHPWLIETNINRTDLVQNFLLVREQICKNSETANLIRTPRSRLEQTGCIRTDHDQNHPSIMEQRRNILDEIQIPQHSLIVENINSIHEAQNYTSDTVEEVLLISNDEESCSSCCKMC